MGASTMTRSVKRSLLERIDIEIAAGRAWRAKEILRGNLAFRWPEPAVIERYGQLLVTLGDELEGGKYLFLSAARKPEYSSAIELFKARHRDSHNLLSALPKTFRRLQFADLPSELQRELSSSGVVPARFGHRDERTTAPTNRWSRMFNLFGGLAMGAFLLATFAIGFRTILSWVARALR
jgi:hypothetical protein